MWRVLYCKSVIIYVNNSLQSVLVADHHSKLIFTPGDFTCNSYTICIHVAGRHHIHLIYHPYFYNGVTCSSEHIFVADNGHSVNIHTWSGQHTQRITYQQLGLQEGEVLVPALQYNSKDHTMHLAVGDVQDRDVQSLHVYKVSKC